MYAILPLTVSEWSEDATTISSCPPVASDYPAPLSLTQPLPASDHVTSWPPTGDGTEKILLAIYRDRLDVAWGFRIQGGREFGTPLVVQKVFPGTPADGQLLEGDVIHFIDGHAGSDLIHNRALEIIKNATGYLNFTIERKLGFKPAQPMPVFTHYNTPVSNNFAPPQPDAKTGKRTILRREVEKVEKLENSIIFKPIYDTLPWPKEQHGQGQQQHQQPTESQVSTDVYKRPVGKVVVKRGSSAKFREKPVDRLYKVSDSFEGVPTGLQHPGWVPKAKSSPKPAPVDPPKQPYKSMAEKLDDPNYLPNLLHREPSPEVNKPAPRRQIIADFAEVKKEEDVPAWLGSLRSTGALLPFEKRAGLLHGSDPDPDFQYESVHQRVGEIQSKKFGEWESTEYGVETSEAKEYPADHVKSTESHPKADSSAEVKQENQEVSPGQPLQNGIGPEATVEHAETTKVLEAKPDVPSGQVVAEEIKQEGPVASESEGVKKEPAAATQEPAESSGPETVPEAKLDQHTSAETQKAPETKPEQPTAAKPDVIPETTQEHAVVPEPEKVAEIKQEQATAPEAGKVPETKQEQPAASEPLKVPEPKPEQATVTEPEKVPETKEAVVPAEPEKVPEPKPEPAAATEPEKVPDPVAATEPEKVPEPKPEPVATTEPKKVPEPKPEPVAATEPEKIPEPKPEQATVPESEKLPETKEAVAPAEPEKVPEQTAPTEPEKVPETKQEQAAAPAPENVPEPKPEQAAAPAPENVPEPKPEQAVAPASENVPEPKPEQAAAPASENVPEPKPEQAAVPAENVSSEASQDNQGQSITPETGEVKQEP